MHKKNNTIIKIKTLLYWLIILFVYCTMSPATEYKPSEMAVFSFIFKHLTLSENLSCYLPKFQSSSDNFL